MLVCPVCNGESVWENWRWKVQHEERCAQGGWDDGLEEYAKFIYANKEKLLEMFRCPKL